MNLEAEPAVHGPSGISRETASETAPKGKDLVIARALAIFGHGNRR